MGRGGGSQWQLPIDSETLAWWYTCLLHLLFLPPLRYELQSSSSWLVCWRCRVASAWGPKGGTQAGPWRRLCRRTWLSSWMCKAWAGRRRSLRTRGSHSGWRSNLRRRKTAPSSAGSYWPPAHLHRSCLHHWTEPCNVPVLHLQSVSPVWWISWKLWKQNNRCQSLGVQTLNLVCPYSPVTTSLRDSKTKMLFFF